MSKAPASPVRRGRPPVTRRYGGVGPQERQRQRRERLIAAGLALFGTRGFHATTVRDLCREAGLTERYFYESFRNLADAFFATQRECNEAFKEVLLNAIASHLGRPPMDLARAAIVAELDYCRAHPQAAHIVLVEAPTLRHLGDLPDQMLGDYGSLMRSILTLLYPEAPGLGLNVDLIATGLVGLNISTVTTWVRSGYRQPQADVLGSIMLSLESMHERFLVLRAQSEPVPVRTP